MKVKCFFFFILIFSFFFSNLAYTETVYWGLFVGIGDSLATKYAILMYETLTNQPYQNFSPENCFLIIPEATKQEIYDTLQNIIILIQASDPERDDILFIYWAGPGDFFAESMPPYDEADGKDEALLTLDSPILDDELKAWLEPLPYVILLLDACYSGGFSDLTEIDSNSTLPLQKSFSSLDNGYQDQELLKNKINPIGRVLVSSCGEHEINGSTNQWLFSSLIIQALNESFALADIDGNEILSVEEVFLWVDFFVPIWTQGEQNPQLFDTDGCVELLFACQTLTGCNSNRHDLSHFQADGLFLDNYEIQIPTYSTKTIYFITNQEEITWENLSPDKIRITPLSNNSTLVETLTDIPEIDPAYLKAIGNGSEICQQNLSIFTEGESENQPPFPPTLLEPENSSIIAPGMVSFTWLNNGDPDQDLTFSWLYALGPWGQVISIGLGVEGSAVGEEISCSIPLFNEQTWSWTVYIYDPLYLSDPYYSFQKPFWSFTTSF